MATKSRRPPVVMSTPPPAKSRSMYTPAEKESLLENFDLEVSDKTRAFTSALSATLSSFLLRQETEIFRIPRELRSMTIRELRDKWGGSWTGTLQNFAKGRIEEREREEERKEKEKELELQVIAAGKRKRNTTEGSPSRSNKSARREPETKRATGKTRKPVTKRQKASTSTAGYTSNSTASTLPQDHIFNPLLPPKPSYPRQPRRNESLLSANGSPLANPFSHADPNLSPSPSSTHDLEDEDEYDLPDPEAMERAAALHQVSAVTPKSGPSRKKRAPSLMFRQSLAHPSTSHTSASASGSATSGGEDMILASIPLSDGRVLSFNPLNLSPGRIDSEMSEGGLGVEEREKVKVKVKEEVVKALTEKMAKWQVMP